MKLVLFFFLLSKCFLIATCNEVLHTNKAREKDVRFGSRVEKANAITTTCEYKEVKGFLILFQGRLRPETHKRFSINTVIMCIEDSFSTSVRWNIEVSYISLLLGRNLFPEC